IVLSVSTNPPACVGEPQGGRGLKGRSRRGVAPSSPPPTGPPTGPPPTGPPPTGPQLARGLPAPPRPSGPTNTRRATPSPDAQQRAPEHRHERAQVALSRHHRPAELRDHEAGVQSPQGFGDDRGRSAGELGDGDAHTFARLERQAHRTLHVVGAILV